MEFLILMIVVFFILRLIVPKPDLGNQDSVVKFKEKVCPPHKWRHVEIKDENGNLVNWRLVCDLCGPLAPQEDVKREL